MKTMNAFGLAILSLVAAKVTSDQAGRRMEPSRFNWKSGTNSECDSSSDKLVDDEFIKTHEGFKLNGYVPCSPSKISSCSSGVTVGVGEDLGSKSDEYFKGKLDPNKPLDASLLQKIQPYFLLKGQQALDKLVQLPLTLTSEEELRLRGIVFDQIMSSLNRVYEKHRDPAVTKPFKELPFAVRTAIFDFVYQHGSFNYRNNIPSNIKTIRDAIYNAFLTNDFKGLSANLRNLGEAIPSFRSRRRDEADLIDSIFITCDRLLDILFLVDESGSIGIDNFRQAQDLMISFVRDFENKKSRVGIVTFDDTTTIVHELDFFQNSEAIIKDIDAHKYRGGGTQTGKAMTFSIDLLLKNQRPPEDGVSPILYVLTDGMSQDSVIEPAQRARDLKMIITAIGIGTGINVNELRDIAYDPAHVIQFADYKQLKCNLKRMQAESCVQPKFVPSSKAINGQLKGSDADYLSFEVNKSEGLIITVNKTDDKNPIKLYAGIDDPNPDSLSKDINHSGKNTKSEKVTIVYKENKVCLPKKFYEKSENSQKLIQNNSEGPLMDFIVELLDEIENFFREPYDDADFDMPPLKKQYKDQTYNVFLTLKGDSNETVQYNLATETCKIGTPGCETSSNDNSDVKPSRFWLWLLLIVVLLIAGYIGYKIWLKSKNKNDYLAA